MTTNPTNSASDAVWSRVAFSKMRVISILVLAATVRIVTGLLFSLLEIPQGWSGAATIIVTFGAVFIGPFSYDGRKRSNLISVAVNRPVALNYGDSSSMGVPSWPRVVRGKVIRMHLLALTVLVVLLASAVLEGAAAFAIIVGLFAAFTILLATAFSFRRDEG